MKLSSAMVLQVPQSTIASKMKVRGRVYIYIFVPNIYIDLQIVFQINTSNTLLAATEMDAVPLLPLASIFDSLMHKSRPIDRC
jgi:hypothetical protein